MNKFVLMNRVLTSILKPEDKVLLVELILRSDDTGECYPSVERLCQVRGIRHEKNFRGAEVYLTGLRPSPTSRAVVTCQFSRKLTQGPAVRGADRRHPLRLDMLTMTRSAYLQVRCAVVAQMERAVLTLHRLFGPPRAKLDSKLRLCRT